MYNEIRNPLIFSEHYAIQMEIPLFRIQRIHRYLCEHAQSSQLKWLGGHDNYFRLF